MPGAAEGRSAGVMTSSLPCAGRESVRLKSVRPSRAETVTTACDSGALKRMRQASEFRLSETGDADRPGRAMPVVAACFSASCRPL